MEGNTLITGASAGIGRALAREFAQNGDDVVLVARREEKLRETAVRFEREHGVTAHIVILDLAVPEAPERLYEIVRERELRVDVLVNNVGIGTQGRFVDIDLQRERDQLRLNVVTPTVLAKLFGREMANRGNGGILNVSSSAAFQPGPYMAVYYASKAYLLSLSEALYEEFRADGVTVTALCPGPVSTEFQERAGNTDAPIGREGEGLIRWQCVDAVARAGYKGLMNGRAVVIPGLDYKFLERLTRVTPRPLRRRLVATLNRG